MALKVQNFQRLQRLLLLYRQPLADLSPGRGGASALKSRCLSSSPSPSSSSSSPASLSYRDGSFNHCKPLDGNGGSRCSRDYHRYAYMPLRQLPVLVPVEQRRSFKRDLFLKATSDHAALQYLQNEYEGVAVISLNRSEARNAIGAEMLKQLHSIVQGLRHGTSARVLIVCSTVPGVFCAGADLKERQKMGFSETEKFVSSLRSTFSDLEELQIPTIAVIEGAALGGGLELALACDLRVCGEEAVFGLPETSLAIIPGAGGTQRLPRVIGRSRAKELIFTADRVNAKRAEALGLVDHCVAEGEAYTKALSIAQKILDRGPLAVKIAKHAIDHGIEMDPTKGMLFEEACYSRLLRSSDRLEGLAAFAEKRKPFYRGE
ncbi:unnamed protein product [Calypogeia fissa]